MSGILHDSIIETNYKLGQIFQLEENTNQLFLLIIFRMDNFGIDDYDSGQMMRPLHYFPDQYEVEKDYPQKRTSPSSPICDDIFKQDQDEVLKNQDKEERKHEKFSHSHRIKKKILVQSNRRHSYLRAKKGGKQETNDLSINVCTLFKSFFLEYETFQRMSNQDFQLMKQFKSSKFNLNSLRKLLSNIQEKNSLTDCSKNLYQNQGVSSSLGQFFSNKLQEPQTMKDFLKSKKMKFCNKIVFLKYLQVIKTCSEKPHMLSGWKNNKS